MNQRSFNPGSVPERAMAAGHPAPAPDRFAGDRALLDLATRYARLTAWLFALLGALPFFAIAASMAAAEFGLAPGGMAADAFAELLWSSAGIPLHEHP